MRKSVYFFVLILSLLFVHSASFACCNNAEASCCHPTYTITDCPHEAVQFPVIVHNQKTFGVVSISNTSTMLIISVDLTQTEYDLCDIQIFAEPYKACCDMVPFDYRGRLFLERFPFQQQVMTCSKQATFTIDTSSIQCFTCEGHQLLHMIIALQLMTASDEVIGFAKGSDVIAWKCCPKFYDLVYDFCCEGTSHCEGGCTLTQGYWKNHTGPNDWPAPYDPATSSLCGGLFTTILDTPPAGGDAWYILAHQWIAATLNVANGACVTSDVASALSASETLLLAYCGTENIPANSPDGQEATSLSTLLDDYNNGIIGPGHCP